LEELVQAPANKGQNTLFDSTKYMLLVYITVYITQFNVTEDTLTSTDLFFYYGESFTQCPPLQ